MNAYEVAQIEKQMRAGFQLPLDLQEWSVLERQARQERARILGKMFSGFFAAAYAKLTGAASQIRSTAAECTSARLRHDH